jgi:hypothetical protein
MICCQLFSCDATASAHSFEVGGVMKDVEVPELGDVGSTFTPHRQDRQNQAKFAYVGQIVLRLRIRPCKQIVVPGNPT